MATRGPRQIAAPSNQSTRQQAKHDVRLHRPRFQQSIPLASLAQSTSGRD